MLQKLVLVHQQLTNKISTCSKIKSSCIMVSDLYSRHFTVTSIWNLRQEEAGARIVSLDIRSTCIFKVERGVK